MLDHTQTQWQWTIDVYFGSSSKTRFNIHIQTRVDTMCMFKYRYIDMYARWKIIPVWILLWALLMKLWGFLLCSLVSNELIPTPSLYYNNIIVVWKNNGDRRIEKKSSDENWNVPFELCLVSRLHTRRANWFCYYASLLPNPYECEGPLNTMSIYNLRVQHTLSSLYENGSRASSLSTLGLQQSNENRIGMKNDMTK